MKNIIIAKELIHLAKEIVGVMDNRKWHNNPTNQNPEQESTIENAKKMNKDENIKTNFDWFKSGLMQYGGNPCTYGEPVDLSHEVVIKQLEIYMRFDLNQLYDLVGSSVLKIDEIIKMNGFEDALKTAAYRGIAERMYENRSNSEADIERYVKRLTMAVSNVDNIDGYFMEEYSQDFVGTKFMLDIHVGKNKEWSGYICKSLKDKNPDFNMKKP